jgi:hypothetical protein
MSILPTTATLLSNALEVKDPSFSRNTAMAGSSPTLLRSENESVIDSIFQEAADFRTAPEDNISACSAVTQLTQPLLVQPKPPWPITTPLHLVALLWPEDCWRPMSRTLVMCQTNLITKFSLIFRS